MNAAKSGDVVCIGAGRYVEDVTITKSLTLRARAGEAVLLRNATSNGVLADARRTLAVTGGDLKLIDIAVDGDSSYAHDLYGGGISTDGSLTLLGSSSVRNGYADKGGGISVTGNGLVVKVTDDAVLQANSADTHGGGLYVSGESDLVIGKSVRILGNHADSYGGGVYGSDGVNVDVSGEVLIDGNTAAASAGGIGVINWSSSRNFTVAFSGDVVISNNTVTWDGGGMNVYGARGLDGTMTIGDRVRFTGNQAVRGAGFHSWHVDLAMSGAVLLEDNIGVKRPNTIPEGMGGGIMIGGHAPYRARIVTLTDSVRIVNNTADIGAGMRVTHCDLTIGGEATIASNVATNNGGGMYIWQGTNLPATVTVIESATITGNAATTSTGGGVYSQDAATVLTAVAGSITNNTPDNCAGLGISC